MVDNWSKLNGKVIYFLVELGTAISLPIFLLLGLTFPFMSDEIPIWVQQIDRKNLTLWNFSIAAIRTMKVIISFQENKKKWN